MTIQVDEYLTPSDVTMTSPEGHTGSLTTACGRSRVWTGNWTKGSELGKLPRPNGHGAEPRPVQMPCQAPVTIYD